MQKDYQIGKRKRDNIQDEERNTKEKKEFKQEKEGKSARNRRKKDES